MSFEGKVAVVTGGSRGIGRACALRLAQRGADVAVLDINLDGAAEYGEVLSAPTVSGEIEAKGRRGLGVQLDLSDRSAVEGAVAEIVAKLGRIDIWAHVAGGGTTPGERSFASMVPDEDIDLILRNNLMSTIYCCQAVAPLMIAQKSGVIVTTASVAARTIRPNGSIAHYGAAKAAVAHYTRSLAAELGPHGIRVNCMAPGRILTARVALKTDPATVDQIPLRRFGRPEDCADVVEFLASDQSSYITGQCISVCGGVALTPA